MRACRAVVVFAALLFLAVCGEAQTIKASEARSHVGEVATVCGSVASTHFAATSRGRPTFINLDQPYPRQIFTIVIWGSERRNFGTPERTYQGKNVCVKGTIQSYRGVPEIIAYEPSQITIQ